VKVRKITVCGGGNGAQTLVPIAARNLGCLVDIYAPFGLAVSRTIASLAGVRTPMMDWARTIWDGVSTRRASRRSRDWRGWRRQSPSRLED